MRIDHASGCTEEKNGNKYFIFDDFADENKELLKKYAELCDGIKNKIKAINGGKEIITEKIIWKLNLILTMTCH